MRVTAGLGREGCGVEVWADRDEGLGVVVETFEGIAVQMDMDGDEEITPEEFKNLSRPLEEHCKHLMRVSTVADGYNSGRSLCLSMVALVVVVVVMMVIMMNSVFFAWQRDSQ